jgi:ubiquinone/menaquinone biosynthesis C-methylase UbiE
VSWDEAFSQHYDDWAAHMTADVPFYCRLASDADGDLVELAVGNGRVAIPVAKAAGRKVIGLDTSPKMLARARERAQRYEIWAPVCRVAGPRGDRAG